MGGVVNKFKITNRHGTLIWEGEAYSFWEAWQHMFETCKYPMKNEARKISDQINLGLWIEKLL